MNAHPGYGRQPMRLGNNVPLGEDSGTPRVVVGIPSAGRAEILTGTVRAI